MRRLVLGLLACAPAIAACGTSDNEPRQYLPPPASPSFTLLVSNQSFDLDPVDIVIRLDGQIAVAGDFRVEGQHTWLPFELDVAPGAHTISAVSETGDAELAMSFAMDERKWGVVMFWYDDADDGGRQLTFSLSDEQPLFD
jgi:hypothetical protein